MLARVGLRAVRPSARLFSTAASKDKSLEYLNKHAEPKIDNPEELQKRVLMGVHPKIVQSKAFENTSLSAMRMNTATHAEGQHPSVTKLIDDANEIDSTVDAQMATIANLDPLYDLTRHFEFGNYRKKDEDSVLKQDLDWDFFRAAFPDKQFIDDLKENYEKSIQDAVEEAESDPIPEQLRVFERFANQLDTYLDARISPILDTADDAEYDLRNVPEAIEDIIHDWDLVKIWTAAPRVAAVAQHKVDNHIFALEDESIWLELDKAVR
jgi:hypothetical protein